MEKKPKPLFQRGDDEALLRERLSKYDSNPNRKIKGAFVKCVANGEILYEGENLCDAVFCKQGEQLLLSIVPNSTGGLTMFFDEQHPADIYAFSVKEMLLCHLLDIRPDEWAVIFNGNSDN